MPNGQGTYSHPHLSGYTGNQNQNSMSGIGGAALSMLGGAIGAGSQHRRQRELMGIQYANQMKLNQQGHNLQMDMWNKTNYAAQVKHMKEAGLNPGLMYGSAGQGGQTGSQGGGSAASGSAAAFNPMDVANLMLLKAQENKLKAETRTEDERADDLRSQINKRDGYEGDESRARAGESRARTVGIGIDNAIRDIERQGLEKNEKAYYKSVAAKLEKDIIDKNVAGILGEIEKDNLRLKKAGFHKNDYIATILEGGLGIKAEQLNENHTLDIPVLGRKTMTNRQWIQAVIGIGYGSKKLYEWSPWGKADKYGKEILEALIGVLK